VPSLAVPYATEVSLNNGDGTFTAPSAWTTNSFCATNQAYVNWGTADANGDGKTDEWCHRGESELDAIWVGLSDGTSFTESQWDQWCWTVDAFFTMGPDVDGDGKSDAVCRGASSGFVDVKLSTGTSLVGSTFRTLKYWCGYPSTFGQGDFNGAVKRTCGAGCRRVRAGACTWRCRTGRTGRASTAPEITPRYPSGAGRRFRWGWAITTGTGAPI